MTITKAQPGYFSLTIKVGAGNLLEIKGCRVIYHDNQLIYKLALPTSLAQSGICWLAEENKGWKCLLGNPADEVLSALINALIEARPVHQLENPRTLQESA